MLAASPTCGAPLPWPLMEEEQQEQARLLIYHSIRERGIEIQREERGRTGG